MKTKIIMPKLGLTMENGTIVSWLKRQGDHVAEGEPLLEIETDKVIEEVCAQISGTLSEITRKEGETVPVSETVGFIEAANGEAARSRPAASMSAAGYVSPSGSGPQGSRLDRLIAAAQASKKQAAPRRPEVTDVSPRHRSTAAWAVKISHRARALAKARGVDPAAMPPGSGPAGRILERDVLAWLSEGGSAAAGAETENPAAQAEAPESPKAASRAPSPVHRLMAERMTESFSRVPHFYLTVEARAQRLIASRQELQPRIDRPEGVRLTLTDLVVKAAADALARHPRLNVRWDRGSIRELRDVNIAFAVDTPRGLMVPVIKNADAKTVVDISRERASLVEKARAGRLSRQEVSDGSITVTNLGMYGVDRFQAIINPPQSAILAVGAVKDRPVGVDGRLALAPTVFLTLSVDHRAANGVEAACFLQSLTELIENPKEIGSIRPDAVPQENQERGGI